MIEGFVSACHRKTLYKSKSKAREALATMREGGSTGLVRLTYNLEVYKCGNCACWHLGRRHR